MNPTVVLFDRDGTLIKDRPYNGNPALVEPLPLAGKALTRLRAAGVRTGVVTNQSGIARDLITESQVESVNARVDQILGPFDTWQICPHGPDDGCSCRKPAPGLIFAACAQLRVSPADVVVIGDIESDILAADNAGARAVLVPTTVTRSDEVHRAPVTASDLLAAVEWVLS
ncbi:HAD family hydrolase [Kibdelosporangium philippinense]|uniref:D,D-heptose 1,7-bisphosphate phosphatase n=1 Tax=Kibdelosporangium philippinense TaxID=211113 RepID=A0ABS8Z861_9PSEU|nr:HAD family hydrolase [Kibdelosporangium philippinense]MCE7003692.1 HAD family hydrolase [Kibdelosporangium philippinense]